MACLNSLSLLSCSGWHVIPGLFLADSFWVIHPDRPVPAVLSLPFRPGCHDSAGCTGRHVSAVLSGTSWIGYPVLDVGITPKEQAEWNIIVCGILMACPVPLPRPSCPVLAFLSRLSCRGCPVAAVLPRLSCVICPVLYVLSRLYC